MSVRPQAADDEQAAAAETPADQKDIHQEPVRLIDCFVEIIGYTRYLLPRMGTDAPPFAEVRDHYKALFARSQEKARANRLPTVEWKKGCFPVCAWVDEMLLCSEWPEKAQWRSNQLQLRFFRTTNAGEEFFARLEKLKDKETDVREVYLYCLSLGFTGQFFKDTDDLHLAEIRTDNLLKLFPNDEDMNLPPELFPEGYAARQPAKKGWKKGLPPALIIGLIIPPALIVLLYTVFNIHLAGMTRHFTRTLESARSAVVKTEAAADTRPIQKPKLITPDKSYGDTAP
ncbi:MAG: DotU family type IV/VI secretion system protein [Thermodesulfobacteriota bacterium]|nr:DotU family type IV/VI secretion system protein [Thermodesulfobacteriota bacterium]